MSTVRGYGRLLGAIGGPANLIAKTVFTADSAPLVVADWFFPAGPPPVVGIPYVWLSPPMRYRPDKPLTTAVVTAGAATARLQDDASLAEYGDSPFTADMSSVLADDAASLAEHVMTYYATQPGEVPRARMPALTLNLVDRTDGERLTILGVTQGQRIHITGAPATWPEGMAHQIVEGIHHMRSDAAIVEWNTSPVIGASPGVAGPWFRSGSSLTSSDHMMPF